MSFLIRDDGKGGGGREGLFGLWGEDEKADRKNHPFHERPQQKKMGDFEDIILIEISGKKENKTDEGKGGIRYEEYHLDWRTWEW